VPDAQQSARPGRHISPIRVVRRPAAAAALVVGLVVAGVGAAGIALATQTGHPATPVGKPGFVAIPRGKWAAVPEATPQPVAVPVSLVIPAIGVSTKLVNLGLTTAGTLQVPSSTAVAGRWPSSGTPASTRPHSLITSIASKASRPAPPFASLISRPGQPASLAAAHKSGSAPCPSSASRAASRVL